MSQEMYLQHDCEVLPPLPGVVRLRGPEAQSGDWLTLFFDILVIWPIR